MFSRFNLEPVVDRKTIPKVSWGHSGKKIQQKFCLITDSSKNVGPSPFDMADKLADEGWDVTLLDLAEKAVAPGHVKANQNAFKYVPLFGMFANTLWYVPVQSLCCYHWLRDQFFDVIAFHHSFGAGYFVLNARRSGLAFASTRLMIMAASTHAYELETSSQFPDGYTDFEINFLERSTLESADAVVDMTGHVLEWMRCTGWNLPSQLCTYQSVDGAGAGSLSEWMLATRRHDQKIDRLPATISVCMATYNRSVFLDQALASLAAQTHADFEVVVVDDGSTDIAVTQVMEKWKAVFSQRGWRWLRQDNTGPSGARNYAASLAKGSHILFMDDDNIAYDDEIERFIKAAASGKDIITCMLGLHPQSLMSLPAVAQLPARSGQDARPLGWIPLGSCVELAPFVNRMGETNSLFKRDVFLALGGFKGDRDMVFEDVDLFIRAALAGYSIDVIPEILVLYRRNIQSRSMAQSIFTSHIDTLKPIAAIMPPHLRNLLLAVRAAWFQRHTEKRGEIPKI